MNPVFTLDQSVEARGVLGYKNMVLSRQLGGPHWRWCRKQKTWDAVPVFEACAMSTVGRQ